MCDGGVQWYQQSGLQQKYAASMTGYTEWLYKNYLIGNGHQLVDLLENGDIQERYLQDVGLPLDTELTEG